MSTLTPAPASEQRAAGPARLAWGRTAWLRAALVALAVWAVLLAIISRVGTTHSLDLLVYHQAASNMLHGGATYAATFADHLNFTYPPFALLFFSPLALLGMHTAVWAWDLCNLAALAVALSVLARRSLSLGTGRAVVLGVLTAGAATLALEPLRNSLLDGQVNFVLIGAIMLDVFVVPRRGRGVLIGLAGAIKLTPLVFVLYLLVVRERAAATRALVAFGAATALSWLVLPGDSRTFWLHQAFSPSHKGGTASDWNQSWWGLTGRLPAADGALHVGLWVLSCAVTLAAGVFVARRYATRGRRPEALFAIALAGLLVSPVSWTHHWSWIAMLPILLCVRGERHRAVTIAMLALLVLTVPSPYGWHLRGAGPVDFSLLFAGAALLCTMAVVELRAARTEAVGHAAALERAGRPAAPLDVPVA